MSAKARLLLVDDHVANLKLLEASLAGLECEMIRATGGAAALESVFRDRVDLVLLDVMMPDIDGIEVLRRIRARTDASYIPVVLITCRGEHEDRLRGLNAGADEFLEKPFDRAILVARVRALLRAKTLQEQSTARAVALERLERERQCLCDDITELKDGQVLLRRAVRARDEFLSLASHELKTPLTSLRLSVDAFGRSASGEALNAEWVGVRIASLDRGLRRLERLVDRLLDASRISSVGVELEAEDVDFCAIVRDSVERARETLERAPPFTVSADEPVVGRWDPVRLASVVDNLLSNAIKYGAGKPIEIAVRRVDLGVRLTVRDHGIGVPIEDQSRIFGQFERAVSEQNYGGFGLGLWIARVIVDAMGGQIRLESGPLSGSVFTVDLPAVRLDLGR